MDKNKLYETIFKRKSIRNYDLTPLDQNMLDNISNQLNKLEPLYEDIKTEFKIIGTDDVKRRMMKKAPYYIAAFSETKEGYLTNIGFMLQQMDLFLSANGIGSCWQGIPKPKKEVLESSKLEFVILLAFGKSKEPLHQRNASEFKRKSLKEISDVAGADELIEAVRVAPSATNSQPWFLSGDKSVIHAYSIKPGFIKGFMTKRYIPIDIGIALYHLKLTAEHFGKKAEIVFDKTAPDNSRRGYNYIASLKQNE